MGFLKEMILHGILFLREINFFPTAFVKNDLIHAVRQAKFWVMVINESFYRKTLEVFMGIEFGFESN